MPITLPTTTTTTNPPPPSQSPPLSPYTKTITHLRTHTFRPLTLTTTREKGAAATIVLRGLANAAHFVIAGLLARGAPWWAPLYYVLDQLVVMYAVGVVAEVRGGRRLLGGWRVVSSFC